jgi:hypothetical protein
MAQESGNRARARLEVLPGAVGLRGTPGDVPNDLDGLLRDAIELRAEVAIHEVFEDPQFLALALERALVGHPDLRLLARHIREQLWIGRRPMD